jgi:amidase
MGAETITETALWRRGATELAAAIRDHEVSSREVIDAHLERIAEVNDKVGAQRVVLAEQAQAAADQADRQLAAGDVVGPLHGVPITVKENVDVAGSATTWGVAAMAEAIAPIDAPVVAHLRDAGAIPIARGNMPDFALRWHTDNALGGATRNPWDAALTPGGSSAGEAVALATGMSPMGVGNDLGGSLRWPSQCAGTAALRPSQGRVPDANVIPPTDSPMSLQLFNSQGPMARRVADLRVAFEAMCRPSGRDPWHVPAPVAGPPIADPVRVTVALPAQTDPAIADGVRRAASALADAGYDVKERDPDGVEEAAQLWVELLTEDIRRIWPMMEPAASDGAKQFIGYVLAESDELDVEGYAMRWLARQALARRFSERQAERPLLLAPVCLRPPFRAGADIESAESVREILASMQAVVAVNLLGLPSIAVPVGSDPTGLPLGVQVIGPRFREDLCLDAGAALESAFGTLTPMNPR